MRFCIRFGCVLALLALAGCTMMPAYHRPDSPVGEQWPAATGMNAVHEGESQTAELAAWREFVADPTVTRLVETALANNRNLRAALHNIEKVRAQYYIQRSGLLPAINAVGGSSGQYVNRHYSQTGSPVVQHQYSANVGFTAFELDLFGRIRSLNESALQQYLATEEAARSVQTALVGEVASAYLNLTADRELLSLARATYDNRKNLYEIIRHKAEMGLSSQLEVNQAQTVMEEARVAAATYEVRAAQGLNALVFLLGAPVPEDVALADKLADIKRFPDVKPGLPSDLLNRRPDIRSAEHALMAMNANIGAARANFFPSISITSSIGTLSPSFDKLFSSGTGSWMFQPQAVLPLFDTGRNIARLRASKADRDMAVAVYEQAVQAAFREVADALAQRAVIEEQLAARRSLMEATQATCTLSNKRHEIGLDSFINVLDAQRGYFSAQQGYIGTLLLREANALNLYKTLGGGWDELDIAALREAERRGGERPAPEKAE